jgi:DNA repair protein RadC
MLISGNGPGGQKQFLALANHPSPEFTKNNPLSANSRFLWTGVATRRLSKVAYGHFGKAFFHRCMLRLNMRPCQFAGISTPSSDRETGVVARAIDPYSINPVVGDFSLTWARSPAIYSKENAVNTAQSIGNTQQDGLLPVLNIIKSRPLTEDEQQVIVTLAFDILAARHQPGLSLCNPNDTTKFLRLKFAEYKNEVFCAIFLDNRHRIISVDELFYGTIDGAAVHPRVVVQQALEVNAAAIIFAHNHPSGVAEPSHADQSLTQRLKDALALIDVRVLDHIVVGNEGTTSFAERGLL